MRRVCIRNTLKNFRLRRKKVTLIFSSNIWTLKRSRRLFISKILSKSDGPVMRVIPLALVRKINYNYDIKRYVWGGRPKDENNGSKIVCWIGGFARRAKKFLHVQQFFRSSQHAEKNFSACTYIQKNTGLEGNLRENMVIFGK